MGDWAHIQSQCCSYLVDGETEPQRVTGSRLTRRLGGRLKLASRVLSFLPPTLYCLTWHGADLEQLPLSLSFCICRKVWGRRVWVQEALEVLLNSRCALSFLSTLVLGSICLHCSRKGPHLMSMGLGGAEG